MDSVRVRLIWFICPISRFFFCSSVPAKPRSSLLCLWKRHVLRCNKSKLCKWNLEERGNSFCHTIAAAAVRDTTVQRAFRLLSSDEFSEIFLKSSCVHDLVVSNRMRPCSFSSIHIRADNFITVRIIVFLKKIRMN